MVNYRAKRGFLMMAALVWALAGCQGLGGEPPIVATVPPVANDALPASANAQDVGATMALGGQVWAQHCAQCHGELGLGVDGGAALPDLTAMTDEQIRTSVANGVVRENLAVQMPAFADLLPPEQLEAVSTYAKMISLARSRGMIDAAADPAAAAAAASDADLPMMALPGTVTNATAGAGLPDALTVTLRVVKSQFEESTYDTPVNADGSYRFENVPISPAYQYVVTADYGDLTFASEVLPGDALSADTALPLTIYESGADDSAIQISRLTSQVSVENGVMQVVEIASFLNTSDRLYATIADGALTSVSMRVPEGAQYQDWMGAGYLVSEDGRRVFDVRPIVPGEQHLMHIAYVMPYTSGTALTTQLDYSLVGRMDILLASDGLSVSSDALPALGVRQVGGRNMPAYGGELSRDAGTTVAYTVNGTPAVVAAPAAAAVVGEATSPLAYVLIGAGVSALTFAVGLYVYERRSKRAAPPSSGVSVLLEQIAALDAQHEAGKLDENEYQRQRADLKARLAEMMNAQSAPN